MWVVLCVWFVAVGGEEVCPPMRDVASSLRVDVKGLGEAGYRGRAKVQFSSH